jgi:signal transduction histidine kinase
MSRLSIGEAIQQVVGVLSDTSDTGKVLPSIARAAREMMSADEAYLLLREGGRLMLRAADGLPEQLVGRSSFRVGEGIEGWVADHGEPVALADAARERRFRDLPGRENRIHSLAAVPMRLRDDVVGVLAVGGISPSVPVGSRITGLEILASIAAVAIENDRLLEQERRRAHQAEVLLDLSGMQDLELCPFLQKVADAIKPALAVNDTEIALMERSGHRVICAGQPTDSTPNRPSPLETDWAAQLLATGQPLLCDDVTQDPLCQSEFRRSGMRSMLAVPILVGGERRGLLRVATNQQNGFRPQDQVFLTMIASQVGLLVERGDLARRQLEVSREQARQQAGQQFLGLVSHELKTPVAVLKAYTELLLHKAEVDPLRAADQDILSRMMEQSDRMLAMIEQLLDLQKLESGRLSLEIGRFDLAEVTRRVAENLQLTAREHRILLHAEGMMPVPGDKRRIEEVLFNLLENAVKYSPAGGEISVTVAIGSGQDGIAPRATVSVADQGIGIPANDMPRIFERFFQGQGKFRRGHVGLGLGLYIAREIVDLHRGRLWVESVEGKGSTFRFTLPLEEVGPEE